MRGQQAIRGHARRPKLKQQITREITHFKGRRPTLHAVSSWWTEADFEIAFARELPRLLAMPLTQSARVIE